MKYDIIDHLVNYYSGDTPWPDLDDAIFNEDYEEVEEEEEDQ